MRARQAITEATRNLDGLYDKRKTEVEIGLQEEQSNFDQLNLKQKASQRVLLEILASQSSSSSGDRSSLAYSITRLHNEEAVETAANETTLLRPGDVVHVIAGSKRRSSGVASQVTGSIFGRACSSRGEPVGRR